MRHCSLKPARIVVFSDQCERNNVKIEWDNTIAWGNRVYDLIGRQHFTNPAGLQLYSECASHFISKTREDDLCHAVDSIGPRMEVVQSIEGFISMTALVFYAVREGT